MVNSGYHPPKHHPLRVVTKMVDSGYHPIKQHPLRIVLEWWAVDVIILSIVLLG